MRSLDPISGNPISPGGTYPPDSSCLALCCATQPGLTQNATSMSSNRVNLRGADIFDKNITRRPMTYEEFRAVALSSEKYDGTIQSLNLPRKQGLYKSTIRYLQEHHPAYLKKRLLIDQKPESNQAHHTYTFINLQTCGQK